MTADDEQSESDEKLVGRILAGDGRAFDLLVARHQRAVYQLGLRLCGNVQDAEDVSIDRRASWTVAAAPWSSSSALAGR